MADDEETSAKQDVSIPPGASKPAKTAVSTAVMSASCVSTSIVTSSAEAAKGMANVQRLTSLVGACVDCEAIPSASAKPTRISASPAKTERPTSAKPRGAESGSVVMV